ncbi:endonuclease, partial [Rhizopogon vinicolor AM-OR11-026]
MKNSLFNLWLEWFIGFCDADANFQVFPKKRSYKKKDGNLSEYYNIGYGFHISLSIKDKSLLEKMKTQLNSIGHIYVYPLRDEVRWAVTKKSELIYLIETVFEKQPLLTQHQRNRYARLRYGVLNSLNRVETLEEYKQILLKNYVKTEIAESYYTSGTAFYNRILGFINGEGCFHVHKKGHLVFYIEHTDKQVLELIKRSLNLTPTIIDRGNRNNTRQVTYSLTISSKKDILSIKD